MTISIPNSMWDKYNEVCDFFIDDNHIGRACKLVYPPKREDCINCIKPVGSISTNIYRHGGPMPFNFGDCPMCGGNGYKEVEVLGDIRLRIYWNRADWIRIAGSIVAEDAEVMIIGYMTDVANLRKASNILLAKDNNEASYMASLTGAPAPWGFGRNRYFIAYLKGV